MSESDELAAAQDKMDEWMENGCRLAWLFYPSKEKTFIYRPNQLVEEQAGYAKVLSGEGVLPEFAFELRWLLDS